MKRLLKPLVGFLLTIAAPVPPLLADFLPTPIWLVDLEVSTCESPIPGLERELELNGVPKETIDNVLLDGQTVYIHARTLRSRELDWNLAKSTMSVSSW